jgi:GTP cyclohydrolase II
MTLHPRLLPTRTERVNRVRADLTMGFPCVLSDGVGAALLVPLEPLDAARFDVLRETCGTPELVIASNRAHAVMTPAAAANLAVGTVCIRPPEGADLDWFRRVCDPALDQVSGVTGPLHVLRTGTSARYSAGMRLVKSAQLIPAFMLFSLATEEEHSPAISDLPFLHVAAEEVLAELASHPALSSIAAAQLPLEAHDVSRLHLFRDPDGTREHYAIQIGALDTATPVLTRLHSACFTGDVLGSLKCDCGPQLRTALARMGEEGSGVLLYLNQEGRGIGLANKMRVYDLQSQGFDTVEANHRLGFEDDERDFRTAAELLRHLGIDAVRLLTNNPAKVATLSGNGIRVAERLPLHVGRTSENQHYLSVKALKSGHIL